MADPREAEGDIASKITVALSYWRVADPITASFLTCRLLVLPLERFHDVLPREGRIVDVGCGHGAVAKYLARRARGRMVVGYDPDSRRIPIARKAARGEENLDYREAYVEPGYEGDLAAVLILGVLCLLDDATCKSVLASVRASLRPGGMLVLSDILKDERDWRYGFHLWRERRFARVGFTKGQGLFVRPLDVWHTMVRDAGFSTVESFEAPVVMHSVFNWVCR